MSKKGFKNKTWGDQYEVNLDYRKPDGYWVHSHIELVRVPLPWEAIGKNKHAEAERLAKQKFPGCKINSVTCA